MHWFQIGKEVRQGYILSPCLFNLHASCEMSSWMKHKLESRLPGQIWITLDMQMTSSLCGKWRGTKEPLDESERGEWKSWLKTKIMASGPISSVQLLSHVWLFVTPWTSARQASMSVTNSQSLLKLMSIESVMPSSHLILCCPLLLLPSTFPSIRVFSKELVLHIRWPKYWSFSFSISPSNEYSGLISFRMDWLDFLAVQGTLKRLLQQQSWKASILCPSAFFIVQLSHPLEKP